MFNRLKNDYILISPEKDIVEFINHNKDTLKIINAMEPHLSTHFPNNEFSLELCDKLGWTTETKLLLNVRVVKLPRPVEVVDFQFRQMIENLPV